MKKLLADAVALDPDQVERVVAPELRAPEQERAVLQEDRDAESADQRRYPRGVAERPVSEALDPDAERAAASIATRNIIANGGPSGHHRLHGSAQPLEHEEADERPHHVDVAVGEVQELQDPVHHRVAEGYQRVDAPEREPTDQLTAEETPVHRVEKIAQTQCGPRDARAALVQSLLRRTTRLGRTPR